ncbi:MAG: type II toxin-antitoxin system VapC family toxin [bacterium]|nr:type II toxin-antitoxin system VapC family toxin [bacterium]
MYCLDSSAIIEILKSSEKGEKIAQLIKDEDLCSTTICEVEVLIGTKGRIERYAQELFKTIYIFEFTKEAAKKSIETGKELQKEGKTLIGADLFITGICKEQNLTLVTCDKGFKDLKSIKVICIE